jgi:hypothetical protein
MINTIKIIIQNIRIMSLRLYDKNDKILFYISKNILKKRITNCLNSVVFGLISNTIQ